MIHWIYQGYTQRGKELDTQIQHIHYKTNQYAKHKVLGISTDSHPAVSVSRNPFTWVGKQIYDSLHPHQVKQLEALIRSFE